MEEIINEIVDVCRLCLNDIHNIKCDSISNAERDKLQIILPDVNLTIFKNLLLCHTCNELVDESFMFKSTCLEIEDNIHNYATEEAQADLEKLIGLRDIDDCQRHKICRTCLNIIEDDLVYELVYEKDDLLVNMLKKCLPEINLQLTKYPVLCEICKSKLKHFYSFFSQCMENEEKMLDFQKNSEGEIFHQIEVIQMISKRKHEIPEINISNVLRSQKKNSNIEHSESSKVSILNEDVNIPTTVYISEVQNESGESHIYNMYSNNGLSKPGLVSSPHEAQLQNNIPQTDNMIDWNDLSGVEELTSSPQAQSRNYVSQTDNINLTVNDSPELELGTSLPHDERDKDSGQEYNSDAPELVATAVNGEEIFEISDDEQVMSVHKKLMYNIRKRSRKIISDEYAFREDFDDRDNDPDFNPDYNDLSDDTFDPRKRHKELRTKKRNSKSNKNRVYIYCKYCSSRHLNESSLDKHIRTCEAAKKYRETKQSVLQVDKNILRQKQNKENRHVKPKVNEADLWKRLQTIQKSLKSLQGLKKNKKVKRKKNKKKKAYDPRKSDQTDLSMQLQFTLKNSTIAGDQKIKVAVDSTGRPQESQNSPFIIENTLIHKSPTSSYSESVVLSDTDVDHSGKIISDLNISDISCRDQNRNRIDSDDVLIVEETGSTNISLTNKDFIMNQTSILNHEKLCVLKCDLCTFNSRIYETMEKHSISHLESTGNCYSCTICTNTFRLAGELNIHLKKFHNLVNYKLFYWCVNCSSVFVSHSQLETHLHKCSQKKNAVIKLFKSNMMIFCMICDFETMDLRKAKLHRKMCNFQEQTVVGDTIEID